MRDVILMNISNYAKNLSESKIRDYIHWYPKSVKEIIKEIMWKSFSDKLCNLLIHLFIVV